MRLSGVEDFRPRLAFDPQKLYTGLWERQSREYAGSVALHVTSEEDVCRWSDAAALSGTYLLELSLQPLDLSS